MKNFVSVREAAKKVFSYGPATKCGGEGDKGHANKKNNIFLFLTVKKGIPRGEAIFIK